MRGRPYSRIGETQRTGRWRPAVPAAGREQQGDDESQQDGQGAQGERGHEVVQNFCAELHAVGVDDHSGDDEVDQQVREGLLALGAEQAGLGTKSPQPMRMNSSATCWAVMTASP